MDHDPSYKLLFSHAEMVADLLRGFVHEEWVAHLDFASLERINASYIGDDLRGRADDLVWRVKFRDDWLYVYLLLEFQSTVDPWMALRMLVYPGMLYQDLVRGHQLTRRGRLPPVLPMVLYNGEPRWTAPCEVAELIAAAPGGLEGYRPSLRYLFYCSTKGESRWGSRRNCKTWRRRCPGWSKAAPPRTFFMSCAACAIG